MSDECREAFEKWQRREDHMDSWQLTRAANGEYDNRHVRIEWRAWQAAWNESRRSGSAGQWRPIPECPCRKCLDTGPDVELFPGLNVKASGTRMVVCANCGNKRCPHATDHTLGCTGSNEPGQAGSDYAGLPPPPGAGE